MTTSFGSFSSEEGDPALPCPIPPGQGSCGTRQRPCVCRFLQSAVPDTQGRGRVLTGHRPLLPQPVLGHSHVQDEDSGAHHSMFPPKLLHHGAGFGEGVL